IPMSMRTRRVATSIPTIPMLTTATGTTDKHDWLLVFTGTEYSNSIGNAVAVQWRRRDEF
ncbi:MAG: hypothetical protein ACREEE_18915, partial [Dongiaceae bacterium]